MDSKVGPYPDCQHSKWRTETGIHEEELQLKSNPAHVSTIRIARCLLKGGWGAPAAGDCPA